MFGLKLVRRDLHIELERRVQAAGLAHTMDPSGFIVVADGDIGPLEKLAFAIAERDIGAKSSRDWFTRGGSKAYCDSERKINETRGVPFVEYETFSDRPWPHRPPGHIEHDYSLVVRNESSLPRGQRPWDRK